MFAIAQALFSRLFNTLRSLMLSTPALRAWCNRTDQETAMNCIRRILPAALLAAPLALAAGQANAAVDVDVNITIDGIVILDYYSQINVNISSALWSSVFTACTGTVTAGRACAHGPVTAAATYDNDQFEVSPAAVPLTGIGPTLDAVPLVLENVYAVRAIALAAANNVSVTISTPANHVLNNTPAASIGISNPSVSETDFPAPGLVQPVYGNVTLQLDMTNASLAGQYTSGSNNDYTLDVTLN